MQGTRGKPPGGVQENCQAVFFVACRSFSSFSLLMGRTWAEALLRLSHLPRWCEVVVFAPFGESSLTFLTMRVEFREE